MQLPHESLHKSHLILSVLEDPLSGVHIFLLLKKTKDKRDQLLGVLFEDQFVWDKIESKRIPAKNVSV